MEIVKAFLGGAGSAALIAGFFALLQWRLNRKAQKEDKAAETKVIDCAARGTEIKELRRLIENLVVADRAILYDRIKYLAKTYISRGYITVEEFEDLDRMHEVYHDNLDGNGFLDELMAAVKRLEKRVS